MRGAWRTYRSSAPDDGVPRDPIFFLSRKRQEAEYGVTDLGPVASGGILKELGFAKAGDRQKFRLFIIHQAFAAPAKTSCMLLST